MQLVLCRALHRETDERPAAGGFGRGIRPRPEAAGRAKASAPGGGELCN